MNGRACSFVCASAVRMCTVPVRGLGMGCVLPTGRGVRTRTTFGGGRGCNKFIPVLGGDSMKIAPTGDIFDQPSGGIT